MPLIRNIDEEKKSYWHSLYTNLERTEALLKLDDCTLFTISGLGAADTSVNRKDNTILLLALALLTKYMQTKRMCIAAVTDISSVDDDCFSLLKSFCDMSKSTEQLLEALMALYPSAKEEDLKTGLFEPLVKKRAQFASVLDKVEFSDSPEHFREQKLYICALDELPYDYMAALSAKSSYLFFESMDDTNLGVNLGVPYIQKPIEVCCNPYPDQNDAVTPARLNRLFDLFKNDITSYTGALDKNLDMEIDSMADFMKDPCQSYFTMLSSIAQGSSQTEHVAAVPVQSDKLAAAGALFYTMYAEMSYQSESHVLYQQMCWHADQLEQLYEALRNAYTEQTGKLDLSYVLKGMRVASYLQELIGTDLSLTLTSIDQIQKNGYNTQEDGQVQDDEIANVCVYGTCKALKDCELELSFNSWYGGESLQTQIHGTVQGTNTLYGIPWLTFENITFDVTVSENNMPIGGSISGIFGKSEQCEGALLILDLNSSGQVSQIMASMREPLTALDAFGAIAGGIDFYELLPAQLRPVVSLGLSTLLFSYDRANHTITSMAFAFENSSENLWVLWEKDGRKLLTARPHIEAAMIHPADLTNRQIMLSMGAFVDIGDAQSGEGVGELWLNASYTVGDASSFCAEMRMASDKISLTKLLELFDIQTELLFDITDLCILADFGNKIYQLSAAVEGEWKLSDQFSVTGLSLQIAERMGRFSAGFAGRMQLCGCINAGVGISYDNGNWQLTATVGSHQDIRMTDLVSSYCGSQMAVQALQEDNPLVAGISLSLCKKPEGIDFEIKATVDQWNISLFDENETVSAQGAVGQKNKQFYGYLQASINLLGADLILRFHYDTSAGFELVWGDFSGYVIKTEKETIAQLSIRNFSVGKMVETFLGWLYGSGFSLDTPWNLLDEIVLDFDLIYCFTAKEFRLSIQKEISLAFCTLQSVDIVYNPNQKQKVAVQLTVRFAWEQEAETLSWDAAQPGSAPVPAGSGSSVFDLRYLAFGQRLRFFEPGYAPEHPADAIAYLKEHTSKEMFPAYDDNCGMLIASDFGILKQEHTYFLNASLVFYDPALYAMSIRLDGPAAKLFAGFSFEIIYVKLSDTLGVFKSKIVLPEAFRQLDLGLFAMTMPDFYIEVYTNGDFLVDFGFPKNGDFSRSFTLSGVVPPGLPLTGSVGIYFGKLSSATAAQAGVFLPQTNRGTFQPVIVFGLGMRMGLGKSIHYGIISGGFSLTASAILEGVFAKWLPYDGSVPAEPWYYNLKGVVSLTGNIYGCIDFAIISASVNLTVNISASFIYTTCRAVLFTISAYVEASASLRINFGLFKITISFHFKIQVKESFQLGSDSVAPWDAANICENVPRYLFGEAAALDIHFDNFISETMQPVCGHLSLSLTAAADEYTGTNQYVLANLMMTIQDGEDFQKLAETMVYWIIASAYGRQVSKKELDAYVVTDTYLAGLEAYLEQSKQPVAKTDAEDFLDRFFEIHIADNAKQLEQLAENETISGVYIPILPETEAAVFYGDQELTRYTFADYNVLSEDAADIFHEMFRKLAVTVEQEQEKTDAVNTVSSCSVGTLVFCDWFAMAAKHIVRSLRLQLRNKQKDACELPALMQYLKEAQFYKELSGMLSRYFLHGLRLPTRMGSGGEMHSLITPLKKGMWVTVQDGKWILPQEAGIFALSGQQFMVYGDDTHKSLLSVALISHSRCLILPASMKLEISQEDGSAKEAANIAAYINAFHLDYEMLPIQAEWIPAVFSYAEPVKINGSNLWNVPEGLYRYFCTPYSASPHFDHYFVKHTDQLEKRKIDIIPLTLLECSITKTNTKGVYWIGTASARDTKILEKIVRIKPDISSVSIMSKEGKSCDAQQSFLSVSQLNFSTDTKPPQNLELEAMSYYDMLLLLWKAFVTNNNGYILSYRDEAGTILEDEVTFVVAYRFQLHEAGSCLPLVNAIMSETELEQGESLAAFANSYSIRIGTEETAFAPQRIKEQYCSDIYAIAQNNEQAVLNEQVKWDFRNMVKQTGSEAKIVSFEAYPQKGDTLALFANRNGTSSGHALWMNREKQCLFAAGQQLNILVQAGFRAGAGSENTNSVINERYRIARQALPDIPSPDSASYVQSILENNYSLLRYAVTGQDGFSSPISANGAKQDPAGKIVYEIVVPANPWIGAGYDACGKLMQNTFDWLDYYGSRLAASFYASKAAGYQDSLLGLAKWQSVSYFWQPKEQSSQMIQIQINFSTDGYENEEQKACAAYFYKRLNMQLQDQNLHIFVTCSLYQNSSDYVNKQALIDFTDRILTFLNTGKAEDLCCTLDVSFSGSSFTEQDLLPLECYFAMERGGLADCGYEEVENVTFAQSQVNLPKDLRSFDKRFRSTFDGWIALTSSSDASASEENKSVAYAYKAANLHIDLDEENSRIYLPRPFSNELLSCDEITVRPYANGAFGNEEYHSFRSIDLNLWMKNAFTCLQHIFSEEIVSAAALTESDYEQLAEVKKKMAKQLSQMLLPGWKDETNVQVPAEAAEVFYQKLLASLEAYFTVKAVVVFVADVNGLPENAALYGILSDSENDYLSYDACKLKNGRKRNFAVPIIGQEIVLDQSGAVLPYGNIDLRFGASYIENNIIPVADGFCASDWHGAITEEIASVKLFEKNTLQVPFPLYIFPEMPQMVTQKAVQATDPYKWNYIFTYAQSYHYPQQIVKCRVKYNVAQSKMKNEQNGLLTALAQVNAAGESIYTDLKQLADQIYAQPSVLPDSECKKQFQQTFQCAVDIFSALSDASFTYCQQAELYTAQKEQICFSVKEQMYGEDLFSIVLDYEGIQPVLAGYESEQAETLTWVFKNEEGYLSYADGQNIRERTMQMPQKDILQYQNAVCELYIEQNSSLCGKKMRDEFVFTTGTVSFASAVNASCIVKETDLAKDKVFGIKLTERLTQYLKNLCADQTMLLQAEAVCTCRQYEKLSAVSYPIFMQARRTVCASNIEAMAVEWTKQLEEWRGKFSSKPFTEKEELAFRLIFFTNTTQVPLLTVEKLYLAGPYITLQ